MIIRSPRAPIFRGDGEVGDGLQRVVGEAQLDVLVVEHPLVLADDRVLGRGQDLDQGRLVEVVQGADDGQAAHELGDEAVLDEVGRLDLRQRAPAALAGRGGLGVGAEAEALLADAALDDLVEAHEGAAADEEDVRGVDLVELLVRVLAAALRAARWRPCPSRILSRACCTPSPETSRVMEGFSSLREILSISSM